MIDEANEVVCIVHCQGPQKADDHDHRRQTQRRTSVACLELQLMHGAPRILQNPNTAMYVEVTELGWRPVLTEMPRCHPRSSHVVASRSPLLQRI
jgi:hypothetical protein